MASVMPDMASTVQKNIKQAKGKWYSVTKTANVYFFSASISKEPTAIFLHMERSQFIFTILSPLYFNSDYWYNLFRRNLDLCRS